MNSKDKLNAGMNVDVSRIKEAVVNFIIPLVCIIATILIGLLLLMPAIKEQPLLHVELEESVKLSKQLKSKKDVLNDLIDFRTIVEENASLMDAVLVSEANVPELLAQVSLIAQEAGFEVTRLAYSYSGVPVASATQTNVTAVVAAPEAYQSVSVSLGVRGSYEQMSTFLSSIENSARLVDVETYRYSRDKEGILDVNFTLNSPYLFVQSSAVTDEALTLDMTSPEFVALLNKIKSLRVYKITPEDISTLVVEEEIVEEGIAEEETVEDETVEEEEAEETPVVVDTSVEEEVPFEF
jgi:Tfp pilus assembly protein PilO